MKHVLLSTLLLAATAVLGVAAGVPTHPIERVKVAKKAPQRAQGQFVRASDGVLPAFVCPVSADGALAADFSCRELTEEATHWEEGFDTPASLDSWAVDPTEEVTWTLSERHFSEIDSGDVSSLFVEGPYQVYKRETSSATSPLIADVPAHATLRAWIGFSLNYDDECRLSIAVSTDDFATDTVLWRSDQQQGERPWAWRELALPLDDFAGQSIRLRFTYGPGGEDMFLTGGYMGDFSIDGLRITAMGSAESIDVETGEKIDFVDTSTGAPVEWQWRFPGGTPSESAEANPTIYYKADGSYDVSLTVKDAEGRVATVSKPAFVNVTGTAPTAKIGLPATFRALPERQPFVAPLAPVRFTDASSGYPTEWNWAFSGTEREAEALGLSQEENPQVAYWFRGMQNVALEVGNAHGSSSDFKQVKVDYSANITNFLPGDAATRFSLDGNGFFPGSNTWGITAYAEHFSAPSRPMRVYGAYVYFLTYRAEEVIDQIAPITVSLYSAKDGLPYQRLDFMTWSAFELDMPQGSQMVGTAFPFTEAPAVSDEFFIVIEGLPEYSETAEVTFAMAPFRDHDNTALFYKDGRWVACNDYFPAGENCTSYLVQLDVAHSVMAPVDGNYAPAEVGERAGTVDYQLFSYLGWQLPAESDAPWARVMNAAPGEYTVDTLHIAYDALPAGCSSREAHLTLTDGITTHTITLVQQAGSGIGHIEAEDTPQYFTLSGIRIAAPTTDAPYLVRRGGRVTKVLPPNKH